MPITCPNCSAPLPDIAAYCVRCGRPTQSQVAVKETPESLLRQVASLLQKHSTRTLGVKFVGAWGIGHENPKAKIASIRFTNRTWIFETGPAFAISAPNRKLLFQDGAWDDIRINVLREDGFQAASSFAQAYHNMTGRNVEIVKKFS